MHVTNLENVPAGARPAERLAPAARRAEERARSATLESEQLALRKLVRQLRSVHEELSNYKALLARFQAAAPEEHEPMVAASRPDLGTAFFTYLDICIKAAHVRHPCPPRCTWKQAPFWPPQCPGMCIHNAGAHEPFMSRLKDPVIGYKFILNCQ